MPGALVTNITASPMRFTTFAPAAATTSPVVASNRSSIDPELLGIELRRDPRVAAQVGEPHRERDDVRGRRARADVAAADRFDVVAVQRVDRVDDAREQLRHDVAVRASAPRRTAGRRASGASMLERTSAISASAICADAVPSVRTSCRIASSPTNSRPMRNRSSNATSASPKLRSNGRGSGNPAARHTRSAKRRRHPGALGDLRECRPGAFGPDEPQGGHAEQAVLLDCLHDLRDRRADLLGEEAQQREAHVRVRGLRVVQPGGDEGR